MGIYLEHGYDSSGCALRQCIHNSDLPDTHNGDLPDATVKSVEPHIRSHQLSGSQRGIDLGFALSALTDVKNPQLLTQFELPYNRPSASAEPSHKKMLSVVNFLLSSFLLLLFSPFIGLLVRYHVFY